MTNTLDFLSHLRMRIDQKKASKEKFLFHLPLFLSDLNKLYDTIEGWLSEAKDAGFVKSITREEVTVEGELVEYKAVCMTIHLSEEKMKLKSPRLSEKHLRGEVSMQYEETAKRANILQREGVWYFYDAKNHQYIDFTKEELERVFICLMDNEAPY